MWSPQLENRGSAARTPYLTTDIYLVISQKLRSSNLQRVSSQRRASPKTFVESFFKIRMKISYLKIIPRSRPASPLKSKMNHRP